MKTEKPRAKSHKLSWPLIVAIKYPSGKTAFQVARMVQGKPIREMYLTRREAETRAAEIRTMTQHQVAVSRINYLVAIGRLTLEMGNSVSVVHGNYKGLTSRAEAERFFALHPNVDSARKILPIPWAAITSRPLAFCDCTITGLPITPDSVRRPVGMLTAARARARLFWAWTKSGLRRKACS
jgi:hypothetical protein